MVRIHSLGSTSALAAGSLLVAAIASAAASTGARTQDSGGSAPSPLAFPSDEELTQGLESVYRPFVETHCASCHSGSSPEAGLDLASPRSAAALADRDVLMAHAVDRVRLGQMPPDSQPRPSAEEVDAFAGYVALALRSAYDPARAGDPGRNVLRRLSNTEYANTVFDVLGVRFDAEEFFPADNVGHGFDNVADAQTLSDLQLERYLDAAATVAESAIAWELPGDPPVRTFVATELEGGHLRARSNRQPTDLRILDSNGECGLTIELPRAGRYLLRARVAANQAGSELARMELRRDSQILGSFDVVTKSILDPEEHEAEFTVPEAGRWWVAAAFTNDFFEPSVDGGRPLDRNLVVHGLEVVGPLDPPGPTELQTALADRFSAERSEKKRLESSVEWLATRLWRRPPTGSDVAKLMKLAPRRAEYDQTLQIALTAILASPRFLLRVEEDPGRSEGIRRLDGYELATRLSYFLWSSAPDEELLALAADDRLQDDDVLANQVDRMLEDPRSGNLARNFASQWLQTRQLAKHSVDLELHPDATPDLLRAMERETLLVFEAVLREKRSIRDLLDSDFTFVNDVLAKHYGIRGIEGSYMRRVPLSGTSRRGILMHASILTVTSQPNRTSPVKRGRWILETLLASPLPPPPPGADSFGDDDPATFDAKTMRERFALHRERAVCASCHDRLDPLGFGLERFDAVGGKRTTVGGQRVDASGVMPDGRSFDGEVELVALVRDADKDGDWYSGPSLVRGVVENLLVYALGRGLDPADRPTVGAVLSRLDPAHPTLDDAIRAIVSSAAFRERRTDTASR
ncbi:MAG: DUF1592 domain-containing protein [Planctomycetota bacterium]